MMDTFKAFQINVLPQVWYGQWRRSAFWRRAGSIFSAQQHSFQVMISKSFPQTHKVVLLSHLFAKLTCLFVQISISKTSWPRQIQGVWSRHHGGLGQAQSPRLGGDIYFDAGERWAGDKCSLTTKNKYHRRLISHVLAFWKLFLPALPELHRQTI